VGVISNGEGLMGDFDKSDLPALPSSIEAREAYFTWGRREYADEIEEIANHITGLSAKGHTSALFGLTAKLDWARGNRTEASNASVRHRNELKVFFNQYFIHHHYGIYERGTAEISTKKEYANLHTSLLVPEKWGINTRLSIVVIKVDWGLDPHQHVFVVNR